ncbi:hypothetical protein HZS_1396 [Henneguya salminicola]|nr:hypothetical protein HZS_1396 [Henneguya salminicola]
MRIEIIIEVNISAIVKSKYSRNRLLKAQRVFRRIERTNEDPKNFLIEYPAKYKLRILYISDNWRAYSCFETKILLMRKISMIQMILMPALKMWRKYRGF